MAKSKTQQALEWLDKHPTKAPHAVAIRFAITPSCLYRAIKRRKGKQICQCCGQVVREGFAIKKGEGHERPI